MLIIENGEVMSPSPTGTASIAISGAHIEAIGAVDRAAVASSFEVEWVDASDCFVVPGVIDPHIHLIGGSGEQGFASASKAIEPEELLAAGITTVVGTLGTDTTTRTPQALLAKVKALRERGFNAWMWTGGYDARPLTGNVRDDIILVEEIIGAGELAIADRRAAHFDDTTLARIASDCYVAGTLTGKAGVLHFHTGDAKERFAQVHALLDRGIPAAALYVGHANRNKELVRDAAGLTRLGVAVDFDLYEQNLGDWLERFDGDLSLLTLSSDAPIGRVATTLEQIRDVVQRGLLPLASALPLVTSNTARILKLKDAGVIEPKRRADLLLLARQTLELRCVVLAGRVAYRA